MKSPSPRAGGIRDGLSGRPAEFVLPAARPWMGVLGRRPSRWRVCDGERLLNSAFFLLSKTGFDWQKRDFFVDLSNKNC